MSSFSGPSFPREHGDCSGRRCGLLRKRHDLLAQAEFDPSKLNQWTLLIGTLPAAYSLSAGQVQTLVMDSRQVEEVLLTAGQSLFAVAILAILSFSIKQAALVAALFSSQLFFTDPSIRYGYSGAYIVLTVVLFIFSRNSRSAFWGMFRQFIGGTLGQVAPVAVNVRNE